MTLCECGCGHETEIGKVSHKPNRFIVGHSYTGRKHSPSTIQKLISVNKNRPSRIGWHHNSTTKKLLSIQLQGRIFTDSWKRKISVAMTGKVHSIQHREKQRIAMTGRRHSPESLAKISGSRCNFWKGGVSFENYPKEFNASLKLKIRDRDNHTCQLCNRLESQFKRKLDVHHIDFDKKNIKLSNLISLCRDCHTITTQYKDYYKSSIIWRL